MALWAPSAAMTCPASTTRSPEASRSVTRTLSRPGCTATTSVPRRTRAVGSERRWRSSTGSSSSCARQAGPVGLSTSTCARVGMPVQRPEPAAAVASDSDSPT